MHPWRVFPVRAGRLIRRRKPPVKLLLATYRESGSRQDCVSSLSMTLLRAESSGGSCAPFPLTLRGRFLLKNSRIEPLNVRQKETPHPGPLPFGRGEGNHRQSICEGSIHGEGEPALRFMGQCAKAVRGLAIVSFRERLAGELDRLRARLRAGAGARL